MEADMACTEGLYEVMQKFNLILNKNGMSEAEAKHELSLDQAIVFLAEFLGFGEAVITEYKYPVIIAPNFRNISAINRRNEEGLILNKYAESKREQPSAPLFTIKKEI
jgi:hypothetical protein